MEYVKTHGYHGANFDSHLTGFVSKKVAEEHSAYQAKERQEAEERSGQIREENRAIRAKAAAEAEAKMDVAARVRQGVKAVLEVLEEEMTQHLQAGYRELTPHQAGGAQRLLPAQPAYSRGQDRALRGTSRPRGRVRHRGLRAPQEDDRRPRGSGA